MSARLLFALTILLTYSCQSSTYEAVGNGAVQHVLQQIQRGACKESEFSDSSTRVQVAISKLTSADVIYWDSSEVIDGWNAIEMAFSLNDGEIRITMLANLKDGRCKTYEAYEIVE